MKEGDCILVTGNNLYKGFKGKITKILPYDMCAEILLEEGILVVLKIIDLQKI